MGLEVRVGEGWGSDGERESVVLKVQQEGDLWGPTYWSSWVWWCLYKLILVLKLYRNHTHTKVKVKLGNRNKIGVLYQCRYPVVLWYCTTVLQNVTTEETGKSVEGISRYYFLQVPDWILAFPLIICETLDKWKTMSLCFFLGKNGITIAPKSSCCED